MANFTQHDLEVLAELIAEKLYEKLKLQRPTPGTLQKMTVPEFAAAIQRSTEYVRRQIRLQKISPSAVNGPPYLISPRALLMYDVTVEEALNRIEQVKVQKQLHPVFKAT